ncbi:MAG: cytochrome c [Thiomicrospira sp.]|uniref:c-type cytochrome n=1 Tax=Thiomicrospira sp. TaxID=935 RepID=UPI0019FFC901|nr:cytochrome c [Thiomicrospira sp.]MBE0492897.1 cytochrome c [Thiomicrospira sp.]
MKKGIITAFALSLISMGAIAMEPPAKSNTCVACHGADGNSLAPNFPKIAGQHAAYLEKALKDYREGLRRNSMMAPFARDLTNEEIKALAEFYSKQTPK